MREESDAYDFSQSSIEAWWCNKMTVVAIVDQLFGTPPSNTCKSVTLLHRATVKDQHIKAKLYLTLTYDNVNETTIR